MKEEEGAMVVADMQSKDKFKNMSKSVGNKQHAGQGALFKSLDKRRKSLKIF